MLPLAWFYRPWANVFEGKIQFFGWCFHFAITGHGISLAGDVSHMLGTAGHLLVCQEYFEWSVKICGRIWKFSPGLY